MAIAQRPTTTSHDALPKDTAAIVADVSDRTATATPDTADAELAVARLEAISDDLTGCAIFGPTGTALACTGDLDTWQHAAAGLLAAADDAAGEAVSHLHVGTEDGEAFAVRQGGLAIVAVSERFPLASLMLSDMRAVLRELARGSLGATLPAEAA